MQQPDSLNQKLSHGLKYELFETELLAPLRGHDLTVDEEFVAALLLDATSAQPIGIKRIQRLNQQLRSFSMKERTVKKIIRVLRKNHEFPILSRRGGGKKKEPAGYWWCQSEDEMNDYYVRAKKQPLDELGTLHRMVKANYPRLAGQLELRDAI